MLAAAIATGGFTLFEPSRLFDGGRDGVVVDPSDVAALFQEEAVYPPLTPAGVGDPVGTVMDRSGNGNYSLASASAARPILRADASGRRYLEFDGVNDNLVLSGYTQGAAAYVAMAIQIDASETFAVVATAASTSGFFSVFQDGDASAVSFAAGAPVCRVNGAAVSTRDELHDATEAVNAVVEFDGLDLSAGLWSEINLMGGYAALEVIGRIYGVVMCSFVPSDGEKENIRRWLAAKSGVVL